MAPSGFRHQNTERPPFGHKSRWQTGAWPVKGHRGCSLEDHHSLCFFPLRRSAKGERKSLLHIMTTTTMGWMRKNTNRSTSIWSARPMIY
jgi:hypothetical protein